jgi:hypothetical protein
MVNNSSQYRMRRESLIYTYKAEPKIGLVLGAGVSTKSEVPTYGKLALRVLELAAAKADFSGPRRWVPRFVKEQRALLAGGKRKTVSPEEVVLCAYTYLGKDAKSLRDITKQALFESANPGKSVNRDVFLKNPQLNAILSFCAAVATSMLAPDCEQEKNNNQKIEVNRKVGGILTTNYDNLLEGAFHKKYRRKLLQPIGRPNTREFHKTLQQIPVYHIHGYIGYREDDSDEENSDNDTRNPELIITETDYFQRFYDPLGFGNYVAISFLRRFPCLFIGSAMSDKNLRRFLFHLKRDSGVLPPNQKKYALLKATGKPVDKLTDDILYHSYGVEVIWMKKFDEVQEILRDMYTSIKSVKENNEWEKVHDYVWPRRKTGAD